MKHRKDGVAVIGFRFNGRSSGKGRHIDPTRKADGIDKPYKRARAPISVGVLAEDELMERGEL